MLEKKEIFINRNRAGTHFILSIKVTLTRNTKVVLKLLDVLNPYIGSVLFFVRQGLLIVLWIQS